MTGILTGDIIGSRKAVMTENWIIPLQLILNSFGTSPEQWEIYRGDSFQLEINDPQATLEAAILIKSAVRKIKKMDVRIAIGIGEKTFHSDTITSSNGSAFVRSIDCYEQMKAQKRSLSVKTGDSSMDNELNTLMRLGLALMDKWTPSMAELVSICVRHPDFSQQAVARLLHISQASVSNGLKRAHFALIEEMNQLYRKKVGQLIMNYQV